MLHSRHRSLWLTAILAVLALVTSACFSGGGGDSGSDDAGPTDAGPPQAGGIYRTTNPSDPPTIDPQKESNFNTHVAVGLTYSKLVDYKTGPDLPYGSEELEGDLAESWESSPDAKTWTFHLRKGVKWQDVAPVSGREFTAADVVCTLDRIRNLPGQQLNLISMVDNYQTPDDYTVVFNLTEPYAGFDYNMAGHFMWIIPCEGAQGQFDLKTQAIGTGPFIFEKWDRDKERVYTKNPTYYDKGKPYLDGIDVTIVPDEGARIAAFRTGKSDALGGISDDSQLDLIQKSVDGVQMRDELAYSPTMVYMNQAVEPFDDLRVRQAVSLAIDRENMMNQLRPGDKSGGELSGPVTPKLTGALDPKEVKELEPYDPDKAKQLLKDAGFPNGFDVTMMLTDGYGQNVVKEAQWVQQDLAEVGINVELDVQDYATYFATSWTKEDYTMGYGLQTPFLTADEYLSSMWKSDGPRNWFNINDPELDTMIDEQRGMTDQDERVEKLQDIQRYIIENVSNPILLYIYNTVTFYAPYVHDMYPHPDYGQRHMKDVWLGEDAPGRTS